MSRGWIAAGSAVAIVTCGIAAFASPRDDAPPVFTAGQADAGRAAYDKACASCHMPDLSGNADAPPLAGSNFMSAWGPRTTKELFDYISEAMPPGGPAQRREAYAAIVAYLLRSNGASAGTAELTASTRARIDTIATLTP